MKILIQNGRVVDPASGRDEIADVAIAAGRIVAIGCRLDPHLRVLARVDLDLSREFFALDEVGCGLTGTCGRAIAT